MDANVNYFYCINFSCVFNHCHGNSSVFYDGKCRDLLEDGACGNDLGMRLYLGEDGAAYCDCMEGWLPIDGKCYQELTFAPDLCKNENEIIRFNKHRRIFFEEPTQEEIHQSKNRYVCEKNICNSTDFLPHLSTWEHKKCHKVPEGNLECELYVGFHADNDSPPLYCCYPENRSSCDVETLLDTNSVFLTKVDNHFYELYIRRRLGKGRRRCWEKLGGGKLELDS